MPAPIMTNLARDLLQSAPGLEVVTDHVELLPDTNLPVHTHPGEEFAYVLDGTIHLWLKDAGERTVSAGEYVKVPKNAVHTVRTGSDGARLVVFRVHEIGQPERSLVDAP